MNGSIPEQDLKRIEELESRLDYTFKDISLLVTALSHSSYANESGDPGIADNERLEFLGDAVLGMIISEILYRTFSGTEGILTRAKNHLVSARTLGRLAEGLHIGEYLLLGKGEEKDGGRTKESLAANAFEAVIGAIYLDGGMQAATDFVGEAFRELIESYSHERVSKRDYKSYLQELLQARQISAPRYEVARERGPDHQKKFEIVLSIDDVYVSRGLGKSKKAAEQEAARIALEKIERGKIELH